MLDGEDELREDGGVVFLAEAADAVEQNGALDLTGEPVGTETKADGDERVWPLDTRLELIWYSMVCMAS